MVDIDKSKFDAIESLVTKGRLKTTETVGELTVGYRTLTHDEEVDAVTRSVGQPFKMKLEMLVYAITSLNGKQIGDAAEERDYLRQLLGKLPSKYVADLYAPFNKLANEIPELTLENVKAPFDQDQPLDQSTKSALTVDTFQTTP